jgi:hypothetical protein
MSAWATAGSEVGSDTDAPCLAAASLTRYRTFWSTAREPTITIVHGPLPRADQDVRRPGRRVDEVAFAQLVLLVLDDQQRRAAEHQEQLVGVLGVVPRADLTRREDPQAEPELRAGIPRQGNHGISLSRFARRPPRRRYGPTMRVPYHEIVAPRSKLAP